MGGAGRNALRLKRKKSRRLTVAGQAPSGESLRDARIVTSAARKCESVDPEVARLAKALQCREQDLIESDGSDVR